MGRAWMVFAFATPTVASALAGQTTGADAPRVPFVLQTAASVRSAGLQGAGAAIVGNAGSVFTNPAGLATIRHISLEGGYQTAPLDGYFAAGAVAWRLSQFDVGVGLHRYDPGMLPLVPGGAGTVSGESREWLGVGSLVYRFGLIALGASGKYVRQTVDGVVEEGTSGDLGLAIAVFDIMALGFSMQNVAGNWRSESALAMPRLTRFGFTMNYVDPQGTVRLLSTLEFQWPDGNPSRVALGAEGGVVPRGVGVLGRIAYRSRTGGTDLPAFVYGASLRLRVLDVDFVYEPNELVDGSRIYRIGFRMAL